MSDAPVAVMGSFVADLAFRTPHLPAWGETVLGSAFRLGPGGKGSNQAVAAARLGARVSFISKLGNDPFGELARRIYANEGIDARFVFESDEATGGASIVVPGACFRLRDDEIDAAREAIQSAGVFMTQLEDALETGRVRPAHSTVARRRDDSQSRAGTAACRFGLLPLRLRDAE